MRAPHRRAALKRDSPLFAPPVLEWPSSDGVLCFIREIAKVIGRRLNIPVVSKSPEEASGAFWLIAHFIQLDGPASSKLTRERLGWQSRQPGLIPDLEHSTSYFKA
jgi:hypothetical protein